MRRVGAACLAWLALTVPVFAAGYDDFTLGVTANLRGESERAVTSFTAALAAPDLVPAYKPTAYYGRAAAYLQLDKCQEANADLQSYETLKGKDNSILILRVWAETCLKDVAAARKNLDALSKGKPGPVDIWELSRIEWRYGLFAEAADTAREAYKALDKKGTLAAYILLWQALSAERAGKPDPAAVAAGLKEIDSYDWPRPIFDYIQGKLTLQKLQKEAESSRESKELAQRCEANFYAAEFLLARNGTAAATPIFLDVAKNCPIDFIELSAAKTELRRLGVAIPKE